MKSKAVHLQLKICNILTSGAYNHLTCCEEFAVRRGSLKMAPVDTETRGSGIRYTQHGA